MVNSPPLRKPKKAKQQAAHNITLLVRRGILLQCISDLLYYVNCNGKSYSGGTRNSLTLFDAALQTWVDLMTEVLQTHVAVL